MLVPLSLLTADPQTILLHSVSPSGLDVERKKCVGFLSHSGKRSWQGRDTGSCSSGQSISTCYFTVCKKWWSQDAVNVRKMNSCCLYDTSLACRTIVLLWCYVFCNIQSSWKSAKIPHAFLSFCFKLKYKIVQGNNDQIKTCYWVLSYLLHCAVFL